jgi:hypothetical protein
MDLYRCQPFRPILDGHFLSNLYGLMTQYILYHWLQAYFNDLRVPKLVSHSHVEIHQYAPQHWE